MRMGGFSWLTRRPLPPVTRTHALFADQSHSIPDNLMALLSHIRAWSCSVEIARSAMAVDFPRAAGFGYEADTGRQVPLFVTLASIQLSLRRLARAQIVNSTNRRLAMHDDGGPQT